jgi:hypothetical protein
MDAARSPIWSDLAAACSLVAGLVHATVAGTHAEGITALALFATTAVVQVCVGVTLLTGPTARSLLVGAVANGAALAALLASRTVGLPFVDLVGPEAMGVQDLTAAVLGTGAVTAAVGARRPRVPVRVARVVRVVRTGGATGPGSEARPAASGPGHGDAGPAATEPEDDAVPLTAVDTQILCPAVGGAAGHGRMRGDRCVGGWSIDPADVGSTCCSTLRG